MASEEFSGDIDKHLRQIVENTARIADLLERLEPFLEPFVSSPAAKFLASRKARANGRAPL